MPFIIQVRMGDKFYAVHPTDGAPYEWASCEEAEKAMRTFYPDTATFTPEKIRVVEAEKSRVEAGKEAP